ncbi:MAG: CDP-diacylglycerol--serine O-phosphatidyltransferase [Vibrionaceae bacterium]
MDSTMANKQFFEKLPQIASHPSQVRTLLSTVSFREQLLQAISSAKTRIYLVALYLQDDEGGREILDALYAAKQANPTLDIKVLVDWHRAQRGLIGADKSEGNTLIYREYAAKHLHQISILGVPVHQKELLGVLHLKGFIIDNDIIYSGASLNDVYLAKNQRYRYDRYHMINNARLAASMVNFIDDNFIDSQAVSSLSQADRPCAKELQPAIRTLRQNLLQARYQFVPQHVASHEVGLTPLVGLGKSQNELNQCICQLIASAQHHLTICTPYFNPPRTILKELRRALRRGVQVTFIVGDKTANDFYSPPSAPFKTISCLPYLYELNLCAFAKRHEALMAKRQLKIRLWKDGENSFHLKGMWVDDHYLLLTGSNLNPRAWKRDLENGILVHDKNGLLAQSTQDELEQIKQHTTMVASYKQLDDIESYPPQVMKLLKKIKRLKADHFLNQLL